MGSNIPTSRLEKSEKHRWGKNLHTLIRASFNEGSMKINNWLFPAFVHVSLLIICLKEFTAIPKNCSFHCKMPQGLDPSTLPVDHYKMDQIQVKQMTITKLTKGIYIYFSS
jgi:hypothetical protein